jgi:Ca2+-binding EF-hand superfamily protein
MNSETTIQDPVAEEPPVIKEKKSNIPEETLQDMQKLWRVFDLKKLNKVDIS